MNFTTVVGRDDVAVELKYCERCGGLWLRRPGQDVVYCKGCQAQLVMLLKGRPAKSVGKNRVRIEWLLGVTDMEVRP